MGFSLITNNEKIGDSFNNVGNVEFVEGDFIDVLKAARDKVHMGYRLITHPLGASIRIMFSPVRTIVLSGEPSEIDEMSIEIIESSIEKYKATMENRNIDYRNKEDYQTIDISLLESALKEAEALKALV